MDDLVIVGGAQSGQGNCLNLLLARFRRRTPGPPPFSSMKSRFKLPDSLLEK
jgi:hypothetical protein